MRIENCSPFRSAPPLRAIPIKKSPRPPNRLRAGRSQPSKEGIGLAGIILICIVLSLVMTPLKSSEEHPRSKSSFVLGGFLGAALSGLGAWFLGASSLATGLITGAGFLTAAVMGPFLLEIVLGLLLYLGWDIPASIIEKMADYQRTHKFKFLEYKRSHADFS